MRLIYLAGIFKTPPLVVGIEIDGQAKGYDLNSLQAKSLVNDEVAGTSVLAVGDKENNSSFVYDRTCEGQFIISKPKRE